MTGKAVFPGGNAQSLNDVAGQPIAEYVHTKSGTVHKLEGPEKAKYICFKATGDYNDGDTWTLNNTPVTVTYNGGEELLPTAVLVGDMVQAVVMGNQVRLMLQKPTPQENSVINWNYIDPVNQRGMGSYTTKDPFIYTLDMIRLRSAALTLNQEYTNINFTGEDTFVPRMAARAICTLKAGQKYTITSLLKVSDNAKGIRFEVTNQSAIITGAVIYLSPMSRFMLVTKTFTSPNDVENPEVEISGSDKTSAGNVAVKALKLEPGKRFTGWPAWNRETEQAKCQRYYFNTINKNNYALISSAAYARTDNRLQCVINAPVSMRTIPVPKIIGEIWVRNYSAAIIKRISEDIASINCYSSLPWALNLDITLTDGTTPFTAGEYYNLIIETMSGNYLEFNANL